MLEQDQISKIKDAVKEFFIKMTIVVSDIEISVSPANLNNKNDGELNILEKEVVDLDVKLDEPQILIGQGGQTLFEIQRLLRTVLNKKLQNVFYFNLDINDYKRKKTEYLKSLAKEAADQVALTKEEKKFLPMSAYERRIVHAELSDRTDIITESRGDGIDRYVVIKPKQ